ncbi:hypothetical protein [Amycolatopsis rubida]|uniref:Uncharacterized protein n=1 Tax=Amycolatopsis rubida TaxID=112413 RepID=A0A1I5XGH5_9PSEU|nr:hypothetical protein [Amycolatopsis rubida]SFQ31060.1 hypothetical protein SAMN05421854_110216 [Amycolatopsis rubida]
MTQPDEEPAFQGFAGWPVPEPPGWGRDYDPFESPADPGDFFLGVGVDHADAAADQLMRARRIPGFRPFDPDAEVRRYNPETEYLYGDEPVDSIGLYTGAFVGRLAWGAEVLRDLHRGDDTALAAEDGEMHGPEKARRLRAFVAEFPAADVHAVADGLESLARALTRKTGAQLPPPLAEKDRRTNQEYADRARLTELSAAIDRYSEQQAMPSPSTASGAEQRAGLGRLAARVAVLDTQNPHLLASLDPGRARVVRDLLPGAAAREHRADWPPPLPQELAPHEMVARPPDLDRSARIKTLLDTLRQGLRERGIPALDQLVNGESVTEPPWRWQRRDLPEELGKGQALQPAGRGLREQETADRAGLDALVAAINEFRAHQDRPFPSSAAGGQMLAERVQRDRLAARVTALVAQNPHLRASLRSEHAAIVGLLLMESAHRENPLSVEMSPTGELVRRVRPARTLGGPPEHGDNRAAISTPDLENEAPHQVFGQDKGTTPAHPGEQADAEPAPAQPHQATRSRDARPGTAASRHGGPAQPPGRAR